MKAISHFLRITVLGGVLFLAPIVVLAFILDKAFGFARRALKPVTAIIPDRFVSGVTAEAIMAIVLIAILCFLAGLFARTRPAQQIMAELESSGAVQGSRLRISETSRRERNGPRRNGRSSGCVRTTRRRVADRGADRRGGQRVGRDFRLQFPEPDVGIGLLRRRATASARPASRSLRLLAASGGAALGPKPF